MDAFGISQEITVKVLIAVVANLAVLKSGQCQLTSMSPFDGQQLFVSNSACANDKSNFLAPDCNSSDFSIAIADLIAGSKRTSSGCDGIFNETCCTFNSRTDCNFALNKTLFSDVVRQCNGNQDCTPGAPSFLYSFCPVGGAIYLDPTKFAFATYYCIDKSRIIGIGGSKVQVSAINTTLYIWNDVFPTSGFSEPQQQYTVTVSLETDVMNTLLMLHTIQRDISADMNITVKNANDDAILTLTDADNTYTLETLYTIDTYLNITIWTGASTDTFLWWIGIEATSGSTITVSYVPLVSSSDDGNSEDNDTSLPAYVIALACLSVLALCVLLAAAIYCWWHSGSWCHSWGCQRTAPNTMDPDDMFHPPPKDMALYDQFRTPSSVIMSLPPNNTAQDVADGDVTENPAHNYNVLSPVDQEEISNNPTVPSPSPQNEPPSRTSTYAYDTNVPDQTDHESIKENPANCRNVLSVVDQEEVSNNPTVPTPSSHDEPPTCTNTSAYNTNSPDQTEHENVDSTEHNCNKGDNDQVDKSHTGEEIDISNRQSSTNAQAEDFPRVLDDETQIAPHALASETAIHESEQVTGAKSKQS